MDVTKNLQNIIETICLSETVDSLHFWGPKLILSAANTSIYDEVYIHIEGAFSIIENEQTIAMGVGDSMRLQQLCRLAFHKISAIKVIAANDLCFIFESGIQLYLFGDNGVFESWQLEARVEEKQLLIVAGPGERVSIFG
ncbi:hypothetical protein [Solibacillus cecembensis]|uniref:hypothetical protein n=1 Tax=Solibacillus cecembensis TaxID=459347 RepID=UPI003D072C02